MPRSILTTFLVLQHMDHICSAVATALQYTPAQGTMETLLAVAWVRP